MIKIGGTEIVDIAIGSTPIEKAYIGSTLVWEKNSPALPYDAQVEWLATDGVAYIDTGFKPKNTTRFEIVMDVPTLEQNTWFFGARNSSSAGQMAVLYNLTDKWSWRFGNKNAANTTVISTGQYTFDNHTSGAPRQIYIKHDGTTITLTATNNTFTCNYNFYIFALNVNGGISSGNMQDGLKCISAKIWDNTTLVRDYIPVRKNGVGYLWDSVTEELFGNARSTGAFTYGNDVS